MGKKNSKGYASVDYRAYRGDYIFYLHSGAEIYVELKAEITNPYGNLFIERWSNFNITAGWLISSKADCLVYHFLDSGEIYIMSLNRLRKWLLQKDLAGTEYGETHYPLKPQNKYDQHNDTRGWLVKIPHLKNNIGAKECRVEKEL